MSEPTKGHLTTVHTCPRCYRKIRGNGFYNHKIACVDKNPRTGGFPALNSYQRKVERRAK